MRLLANVCLLRLIKTNLVPRPDSSQGEINPADISRLHANGSRQLILTFFFSFFFFDNRGCPGQLTHTSTNLTGP